MRRLPSRIALAAVLLTTVPLRGAEPSLAVIVHPERADVLDLAELRAIYLKEVTLWDDGAPVTAINRDAGTAVREHFSRRVLGRESEALAVYWNERYIEGVFPPPTLASHEAVLRYVASHPDAVGYVLAEQVDDSVRVALHID